MRCDHLDRGNAEFILYVLSVLSVIQKIQESLCLHLQSKVLQEQYTAILRKAGLYLPAVILSLQQHCCEKLKSRTVQYLNGCEEGSCGLDDWHPCGGVGG